MISEKPINIAFLSTYPPRECGLATFTQDLVTQLSKIELMSHSKIIAVRNGNLRYDDKVIMELSQNAYGFKNFKRFRNRILHIFYNQHTKKIATA